MLRDYFLHTLGDEEFEDLVAKMCFDLLGSGLIPFSAGKDGGRDAKFNGTANRFPSDREPASGRFVIQAKHTAAADASCSDSEFRRLIDIELPKIERLCGDGLLDHYLLFTNRKLTGRTDEKLEKLIRNAGAKTAHLVPRNRIHAELDTNPALFRSVPALALHQRPLKFEIEDVVEVVGGIHAALSHDAVAYDSAHNFTYLRKNGKKNKLNVLSDDYYAYIERHSIPMFPTIKKYLENPRNKDLVDLYHDSADELKQQITIHRHRFTTFDEVFAELYGTITRANAKLKQKRRLVNVILHYMYFDCDIGRHA